MDYNEIKKFVIKEDNGDNEMGDWYREYYAKRGRNRIIFLFSVFFIIVLLIVLFYNFNKNEGNDIENKSVYLRYGKTKKDYSRIDFIDALKYSLEDYGEYILKTELPKNECYWLDISWDKYSNYLVVERLTAVNGDCSSMSSIIDTIRIKTPSSVNIRSRNGRVCVCGKKIVRMETIGVEYKNINKSSLTLKINSIEDV